MVPYKLRAARKGDVLLIEVRNLVKRYGDHCAVNDVSFTVEKGQICGFLGPNGAGKTTTMNIMTGYTGITRGQIIINGYDISKEPFEAKRCIGYLPEHPPLYGNMTPYEYVAFAAELKNLPGKEREQAIDKVMEITQIQDVRKRLIKNLSKGYRQRVGLAQALLGFPEVIILDEPTVGLDPWQIREIRELIRSLGRDHTVLLSSHILPEVQEVCDQIVIIHKGNVIASGATEEIERKMRGAAIEIIVKSDNADNVKRFLSAVNGIQRVTCKELDNGEVFAELEPVNKDVDLREAIFDACVAEKSKLLMLRPSSMSLESVFLQLISDTDAAGMEEDAAFAAATRGSDVK